MLRALLLSLTVALAVPAFAQDPLKSGSCDQRLDALQAARIAGTQANAERIEVLRRQAAQACLGGTGDATRPSPSVRAPIAVPPTATAVPPPSQPPLMVSPPTVAIERPPVLTTCDAGGCWDSNGTRLNRAGPLLMGPGGMCTTVGTTVHCP